MRQLLLSFCVLASATACGKIQDARDALNFRDVAKANFAEREKYRDMPGTAFTAMQATGTARFDGAARVFIDPVAATDGDNLLLYGDLQMQADFDAGTMTGTIDDIRGGTNITENSVDTVAVGGSIAIGSNQNSIGEGRPNNWSADYAGDLVFFGDTFAVSGQLDGQFVGTDPNATPGFRGIYAADNAGISTVREFVLPTYVEIGATPIN